MRGSSSALAGCGCRPFGVRLCPSGRGVAFSLQSSCQLSECERSSGTPSFSAVFVFLVPLRPPHFPDSSKFGDISRSDSPLFDITEHDGFLDD
jgi:hypothetical protein